MRISTKGRYSLLMLLDLAENIDKGFISLKDIAHRQGISKKYLEQIVTLLNRSDILRTNRGSQGGYMLAKPAGQYTVGEILRITEGGLSPVPCLEGLPDSCEFSGSCKTLHIWQGLEKVMHDYLDSITLEEIMESYRSKGADEYYI